MAPFLTIEWRHSCDKNGAILNFNLPISVIDIEQLLQTKLPICKGIAVLWNEYNIIPFQYTIPQFLAEHCFSVTTQN